VATRTATRLAAASLAGIVAALALATAAPASDATLRVTLDTWSRKIGADAHSVALAARNRHPKRMTSSSVRFQRDALHARAALAAQRPSTAKGTQAQQLAIAAFGNYATAGATWAASGRARLKKQKAVSSSLARKAKAAGAAGNRVLVSAGRLLH
jgi:hypothetical protein